MKTAYPIIMDEVQPAYDVHPSGAIFLGVRYGMSTLVFKERIVEVEDEK